MGPKRTKADHLREVLVDFTAVVAGHGFAPIAGTPFFERPQSDEVQAAIGVQTVAAKLPSSVVALNVSASITLSSVAALCEDLFGRSREIALLGGPLGRFTPRNDSLTEYRFDWQLSTPPQLVRAEKDVAAFAHFAAGIEGPAELRASRLARLPGLRRCFEGGLGETYRFTVPEVAAVIHRLNGDVGAARAACEIARSNRSGRLTAEQLSRLEGFIDPGPD